MEVERERSLKILTGLDQPKLPRDERAKAVSVPSSSHRHRKWRRSAKVPSIPQHQRASGLKVSVKLLERLQQIDRPSFFFLGGGGKRVGLFPSTQSPQPTLEALPRVGPCQGSVRDSYKRKTASSGLPTWLQQVTCTRLRTARHSVRVCAELWMAVGYYLGAGRYIAFWHFEIDNQLELMVAEIWYNLCAPRSVQKKTKNQKKPHQPEKIAVIRILN